MSTVSSSYCTPIVQMFGLSMFPKVKPGDNISAMLSSYIRDASIELRNDDIIIIAQKIISIAENALVDLKTVLPSSDARALSEMTGRDPRLCEVILSECRDKRVEATKGKVIVTIHQLGFRCTSAGVDKSNVGTQDKEMVSLLPKDPDKSARNIRDEIKKIFGIRVAVIINDSFGEPSREGSRGVGIGIAGIEAIRKESTVDLYGQPKNSVINRVDEIASAASTIMGQTNGVPIVIGRGFEYRIDEHACIQDLLVKDSHV